tara:strand:- start:790 stop:1359 length:570 start_codon:yes stop_codon:yes gene_type:complete
MSGPDWNDLPEDTWMLILKFAEWEHPGFPPGHPYAAETWAQRNRDHRGEVDKVFNKKHSDLWGKITHNAGYRLICKATKNWYRQEIYEFMFMSVDWRIKQEMAREERLREWLRERSLKPRFDPMRRRRGPMGANTHVLDKLTKLSAAYHAELNKDNAAHPFKWSNCRWMLLDVHAFSLACACPARAAGI